MEFLFDLLSGSDTGEIPCQARGAKLLRREVQPGLTSLCATSQAAGLCLQHFWWKTPWRAAPEHWLQAQGSQVQVPQRGGIL